jgi:ABC-type antimicrobial peptide transport system permease subunit
LTSQASSALPSAGHDLDFTGSVEQAYGEQARSGRGGHLRRLRIALGAGRREVFALVLKHALGVTVLGACAGVVLALLLGRLLSAVLYGVKPAAPVTFAAVVLFFFAVAAAAGYLPARRATRVDPISALKY